MSTWKSLGQCILSAILALSPAGCASGRGKVKRGDFPVLKKRDLQPVAGFPLPGRDVANDLKREIPDTSPIVGPSHLA